MPVDDDLEVLNSHSAIVGSLQVRRALPQRRRRTVGAWCFADHMGPTDVNEDRGLDIGPHPHTGLQTVTWLIDGQALHRDSLGSEQVISAGELNLMTAGLGVSHAEEATGHYRGVLQGIQLWIAQLGHSREGIPGFEHHDHLPASVLPGGAATVLVGKFSSVTSPALSDSALVGAELRWRGRTDVELEPSYEYGAIVLEGLVEIDGRPLTPGALGYLRPGRDTLSLNATESAIMMLLGGAPLEEEIFMWWNFVARSRAEVDAAYDSWRTNDGRFGEVDSPLAHVDVDAPYWRRDEQ